MNTSLDQCWFVQTPKQRPVFVLLGRTGDQIIMLPAWLEIFKRTGMKPIVVVAREYAPVLEGVSYVEAIPLDLHWYKGMDAARKYAMDNYGESEVLQWWHSRNGNENVPRGAHVIQCHGINWGVDIAKWPNFMTSMWDRAGFSHQEMRTLPLLFDRRSPEREADLVGRFRRNEEKPLLLYNFTGISSPFSHTALVMQHLNLFAARYHCVNLGAIKAARIYDLLGLYDKASLMIGIDSAPNHLAVASKVPAVWFTVNGWNGSTPRGNVALHISYDEIPKRIGELDKIMAIK